MEKKKLYAAIVGYGNRGQVYGDYSLQCPDEFGVAAVIDPKEFKLREAKERYGLSDERLFYDFASFLKSGIECDFVINATMDQFHYETTMEILGAGYDLLVEKPIVPNEKELLDIKNLAEKKGVRVFVCHVLRYSPFYTKIKEILNSGVIGKIMTMEMNEHVCRQHYLASYDRGKWNSEDGCGSGFLLAKCCHDMDIMLWLADSRCESISSFGELSYFKEENAPEGAPYYCLDGCPYRDECAFYAPRFYLKHPKAVDDGLVYAVTDNTDPSHVLETLKKGPYGRCVFHCDNTVVDHQTVDIMFENQVTASFLMTAFTNQCARRIRLMGTKGEIKGDMDAGIIEITDFVSGDQEKIMLHTPAQGHNGSDISMMRDFVRMIGAGKKGKTDAAVSVESHLMALAAEEARKTEKVIEFRGFCK